MWTFKNAVVGRRFYILFSRMLAYARKPLCVYVSDMTREEMVSCMWVWWCLCVSPAYLIAGKLTLSVFVRGCTIVSADTSMNMYEEFLMRNCQNAE